MGKSARYMVATRCITYNHAPYIKETLHGFAIQEATFPVAYIVVDDASTDGEPDVIRKWADANLVAEEGFTLWREMPYGQLSVGKLKVKTNCTFILLLLRENHTQRGMGWKKMEYIAEWYENAKYHALCEGDDYWIHPHKLQMQVEELEKNPSYVLSFTNYSILYMDGRIEKAKIKDLPTNDNYSLAQIIGGNKVATLTALYRVEAYKQSPLLGRLHKWKMGDLPCWIELSQIGLFKHLPEVTAVYRKLDSSASHSTDIIQRLDFIRSTYDIKKCYAEYYHKDLEPKFLDIKMYEALLNETFVSKDIASTKAIFKEAKSKNIYSFDILKTYILAVYPSNPLVMFYLWVRKINK